MEPMMTGQERRPPIFGAEAWTTAAGVEWYHFDWWFALVVTRDFDGDPDALGVQLETTLRSSLHRRADTQAKLSHLADLRTRLDASGLTFGDLAQAEEPDKQVLVKARRKVLDQELDGRTMTPAMRDTPARRLEQRARFGYWDRFPTNPDRFYERLTGRRNDTFVPKGRSFDVTRRLRDRLDKLDGPRRKLPDRLALYRAFHTVGLELAHRGDDSYGVIGELRLDAFTTYLAIDWATAGMDPVDYWQDLCELMVCETHALTYEDDALPFRRVPTGQAELVETTLVGLADEYRAAYEAYQADEAVQLIVWLHVAGRRYSNYVETAHRLGSDHWRPVVALAESALTGNRPQLAVDVFRAADRPGHHREHLRTKCVQLTGESLSDGEGRHVGAGG
jgi:hypothetical protein